METELSQLRERVHQLEMELETLKRNSSGRQKIDEMSAEVVDSNPYRYTQITFSYINFLRGE